jgi:hypothetical protein
MWTYLVILSLSSENHSFLANMAINVSHGWDNEDLFPTYYDFEGVSIDEVIADTLRRAEDGGGGHFPVLEEVVRADGGKDETNRNLDAFQTWAQEGVKDGESVTVYSGAHGGYPRAPHYSRLEPDPPLIKSAAKKG